MLLAFLPTARIAMTAVHQAAADPSERRLAALAVAAAHRVVRAAAGDRTVRVAAGPEAGPAATPPGSADLVRAT